MFGGSNIQPPQARASSYRICYCADSIFENLRFNELEREIYRLSSSFSFD